MVMIKSLYCGQVKANTIAEWMAVFQMAHRFRVRTCINLCRKKMQELTMTFDISIEIIDIWEMAKQPNELNEFLCLASSFLCSHFAWMHSSLWDSAKLGESFYLLSPSGKVSILNSHYFFRCRISLLLYHTSLLMFDGKMPVT